MNSFVKFNYLYRDAGNYKSWGELTFSNPDGFDLDWIDKRLKSAFEQEILFIAHQINVPEVFLYAKQDLNEDDHCFHEYDSVEAIDKFSTEIDARSVKHFLEQVEIASASGWEVFYPSDRIMEIKKHVQS